MNLLLFLQNLQALMNECIGHVIGKPHSPVTGLYIGKMPLGDTDCWFISVFTFCYRCITRVLRGQTVTQNRHNSNEISE